MEASEVRTTVAQNIRRFAEAKNLSLNRVADFAGIARPSLYRCLGGTESMTIDRLAKIAVALEVEPHELLVPSVSYADV